jgi:transcriptional regulator
MAELSGDRIDALVETLLKRTDSSGQRVVKKYTREWLIEMLQGEMLEIIEKKFAGYQAKGLDVVDFVKVMLGIFEHAQSETIYIVLELIELFKVICESQNLKDVIRFKNFTDYIIEVDHQIAGIHPR